MTTAAAKKVERLGDAVPAKEPEIALMAIPPERGAEVWTLARGDIAAAYLANNEPMPNDIPDRLRTREAVLWIALAPGNELLASMVTQLERRPNGEFNCRILAIGGTRMDAWRKLHSKLVAYAKMEGCGKIVAQGRLGWSRAVASEGYVLSQVIVEKVLTPDKEAA